MLRGEFIRADGLVLSNNISLAGAAMILAAAFRNDVPTFYAGLVTGVPNPGMTLADMVEPTVGVGGYGRIAIARSAVGWPNQDVLGTERFIESDWLTWVPGAGAAFDKPIQRVALFGTNVVNPANPIYALSAPLPLPIVLDYNSTLGQRRFKYRIYL